MKRRNKWTSIFILTAIITLVIFLIVGINNKWEILLCGGTAFCFSWLAINVVDLLVTERKKELKNVNRNFFTER